MIDVLVLGTPKLRHQYFALQMIRRFNAFVIMKKYDEQTITKCKGEIPEVIQIHIDNFKETEERFFADKINVNRKLIKEHTIKIITSNINDKENVSIIKKLNPKLIAVHSIDLLKDELINLFPKRIINLHAGLSPYYRGGGTNIFPFYNNELEYVGMTVHYIDMGIDSGDIIHQGRPIFEEDDNTHTIGCKNVLLGTELTCNMIDKYLSLNEPLLAIKQDIKNGKLYRWKDFTQETVEKINKNIQEGMIREYARNPKYVPIVRWGELD